MRFLHQPPIHRLGLDVLQLIIRKIDPYSLSALSQTNRFFNALVQCELSLRSVTWRHPPSLTITSNEPVIDSPSHHNTSTQSSSEPEELCLSMTPPVYHMRCMARVGTKVFMPFMTPDPVCYVFDLITLNWEPIPRKIVYSCCSQSTDKYQPFITAVAAIGSKIYMFGGRQVQSSTLSNSMYVLDTNTFVLQKLHCRGNSPQPRFDHSFDTLYNRYLVVFGGLCLDSSGENDLYIFDTKTDMWIEPGCQGQIPSPRYGHASVMVGDELYIFGGTQVEADGNIVYDMLYKLDCKTWIWSKFDHPEAQRYRRKMYRNSQDISDADYLPANMDRQISFSLEKDCVIETTGNPPRERLQCSLLYISNKLMLFGGQTIRQNREDTNVLHAYSICSVDIFDIRHRHWSKKYTKLIGIADNIYPQDVCCFSVQDICDPRLPGQRLLVLGQQREFDSPTASSGTGFSGSLGGSIYESDSSRHSSCIYGQETSGLNTQNSAGGTQDSEDCSNENPTCGSGSVCTWSSNSAGLGPPIAHHRCNERFLRSPCRQPLGQGGLRLNLSHNYRDSRPIADYDGILNNNNNLEYNPDFQEIHWDFSDHSAPATPTPTQYEQPNSFDQGTSQPFSYNTSNEKQEKDDKHYTSTFMCMTLTINEQAIF